MKLIAYNSGRGGGMMGGRSSEAITYTMDGRCKVNITQKAAHNQPVKRTTYYADGLLEKLSAVCERYNVISWKDLPDEKINMLDGDSGSDTFTFENGTKIVLETGKKYPDSARAMFQEFNKLIEASKGYAEEFVEVFEDEGPFMGMGMMGKLNGQLAKPVKVQETASQSEDTSKWAKVCSCGAKFTGSQKFCAECGAVRARE